MTIPKRVVYVRENQAGKPLKAALTPRGVDATGYATHTYVPLAPIDRLLAEVRRHCTEEPRAGSLRAALREYDRERGAAE